MEFLKFEGVQQRLRIDSSAAKSIMHRAGVGRVRHLVANTLLLQQE